MPRPDDTRAHNPIALLLCAAVLAGCASGSATGLQMPGAEERAAAETAGFEVDPIRSAADLVPTVIPGYDDGFASTAEGGKFPANAIGIFDGAGNVTSATQGRQNPQRSGLGDVPLAVVETAGEGDAGR